MLVSLSVTEELIMMKSEHVGQAAPAWSSKEDAVVQFTGRLYSDLEKHKRYQDLPHVPADGFGAGQSHFRGCFR